MTTPAKSHQTKLTPFERTLISIAISLVVFILITLGHYIFVVKHGPQNMNEFGQFGDYFGGVLNPMLGFATIGLLIFSLIIQTKELSLSRQELRETREEAELSRKAMQAQVAHLEKEAKLNEIVRLLNDVRIQINNKLNQKIIPHIYASETGVALNYDEPKTFAYILSEQFQREAYGSYWSVRQSQKGVQIDNERIANPNTPNWLRLESLTISFSQLVLKYREISNSDEFFVAYRLEAYDYLTLLCETLRTDALIQEIKQLGFEFEPSPCPYD